MDRNKKLVDKRYEFRESLSARRAWIEIFQKRCLQMRNRVALRKESVDRSSLDARAAPTEWVALRKESVDRKA